MRPSFHLISPQDSCGTGAAWLGKGKGLGGAVGGGVAEESGQLHCRRRLLDPGHLNAGNGRCSNSMLSCLELFICGSKPCFVT